MVVQAEDTLVWEQFAASRSPELRERLVLQSVPLVHYHLNRLSISREIGTEYDDLVHQGLIGLIEAVDQFNPSYGTRFSTFASLKVRGRIIDYLRNGDWMTRSARRRVRAIQQATVELWGELHREPEEEEIAQRLNLELDQVRKGLADAGVIIQSLDGSSPDAEEDLSLHDTLADDNQPDPQEQVAEIDLRANLADAIQRLSGREQQVLALYYYEELTLKEIGSVLGISESRVCQLHARAMIHLKALVTNS